MARPPRAGVLAAVVLLGVPGCQRDTPRGDDVASGRRSSTEDLVEALVSDPSPAALLDLLGQRHRDVRKVLGPHRLHYTARFDLAPVEDPGRPKIGEPVLTTQGVADELTLEWASALGETAQFRLEQHNDANEGREVILIDETIYTHLAPRSWFSRELDSEVHELWLDDAYHCLADAVAFAGPQLAVAVETGETLSIELTRARTSDRDQIISDPGSNWRHRAEIESVEGSLSLDRRTGTWRAGELEIRYSVPDKLGRKLRGSMSIQATLEPVAVGEVSISPPDGATPLPERERYEVERAKLLDGLAAP